MLQGASDGTAIGLRRYLAARKHERRATNTVVLGIAPCAGGELRCDDLIVNVSGDLAYTVGYERGAMAVDEEKPEPMSIRVTQIYRREDGEWRLVHRHGDFAPADQSAGKLG